MSASLALYGLRRDGTEFPVDVMLSPLRTDSGLLTIAVIRDITARKRMEASFTVYRQAIANATEAIVFLDRDGRCVEQNAAHRALLGYADEALVGRTPALALGEATFAVIAKALATEGQYAGEVTASTKHGETRHLDVIAFTVRDDAGQPHCHVVMKRDITKRKQAETRATLFRALLDHTSDAIEVIDPDTGRFLDINEQACQLHGYTREEYLALTVPDIDPLVGARPWAETKEKAQRAGTRVIETQHRRKDGSVFPVEVNVTYVRLERDYMLAVVRDITERQHLEAQLLLAQKMEAVGLLAGGIAHDFNNLLMVMNGNCDLLLGQPNLGGEVRRTIEQVREAGRRGAALTQQLLAYGSRQTRASQVLDLNALVTNLGALLHRVLREDIDLALALAPSLEPVCADPNQLEQVLMNLAVNARDAMPDGGKLTIETANVEFTDSTVRGQLVEPGRYVLLAVRDSGHGMDAQTQAHIFDPFFTTKERGRGTGLGLSIVYGIVKQHGGYVFVHSQPGQGTTFKTYLPRAAAEVPAAPAPPPRAAVVGGTETVLVVEDEPGLRALVRTVLQQRGYTVLEARQGIEAILIADQHAGPIHLLLTDVMLPHMNGREVVERVRPVRPEMKVLYLSGYAGNEVVEWGILDPGTSFLQKPCSPETLLRKVREVLMG